MNDLKKLFADELADIYDAEHQLAKILPKMAKMARSPELGSAFELHLEETRSHARRLEDVFRAIGESPRRKSCKGIEGIIDEGELTAAQFEKNSALDAALILAAQKTEHYEITTYGTLCTWARELDNPQALSLLKENLREEKETDVKLSHLAKSGLNLRATQHDTEKKSEMAATVSSLFS